jgi:hypothetical protein
MRLFRTELRLPATWVDAMAFQCFTQPCIPSSKLRRASRDKALGVYSCIRNKEGIPVTELAWSPSACLPWSGRMR